MRQNETTGERPLLASDEFPIACARIYLTTSDVFVTCDTTKRTSLRACHVFNLSCNQSSLSLCQTDLLKFLKFSFQWLIFQFLRLRTFNFIYKNNEFRLKK